MENRIKNIISDIFSFARNISNLQVNFLKALFFLIYFVAFVHFIKEAEYFRVSSLNKETTISQMKDKIEFLENKIGHLEESNAYLNGKQDATRELSRDNSETGKMQPTVSGYQFPTRTRIKLKNPLPN